MSCHYECPFCFRGHDLSGQNTDSRFCTRVSKGWQTDRFDKACCQCLTRYDCNIVFNRDFRAFEFEKSACIHCKERNTNWIWVGCITKLRETAGDDDWHKVNLSRPVLSDDNSIFDIPELSGLKFPLHITDLPSWLGQVTGITRLDLDGCEKLQAKTSELPLSMKNLKLLTELNLDGFKQLSKLPYWIGELTSLTSIKIDRNAAMKSKMTVLPSSMHNLKFLTALDLDGCSKLKQLPEEVGQLTSLTRISLKDCSQMEDIRADTLLEMPELKAVDCSTCNLLWCQPNEPWLEGGGIFSRLPSPHLPGSLTGTHSNWLLALKSIKRMPLWMQSLTQLQALDLNGSTGFVQLPDWLGNLSSLTRLQMDECTVLKSRITELPVSTQQLKLLTELDLRGWSRLERLSDWIGFLTSLTSINIDGCTALKETMEDLPPLQNLRFLTALDLDGCSKLKELPEWIGQLTSLTRINVKDCTELKDIRPVTLLNMPMLKYVDFTNCRELLFQKVPISNLGGELFRTESSHLLLEDYEVQPNFKRLSWQLTFVGLKELPNWVEHLHSLTALHVSSCPNLTQLPDWIGHLTRLTLLQMDGCLDLKANLKQLLPSMQNLTRLTALDLDGCSQLKELPEWVKQLTSLTRIGLKDCSQLDNLRPDTLLEMTALKSVDFTNCNRLWSAQDDVITKGSGRLFRENLHGLKNSSWHLSAKVDAVALPTWMQQLTSLAVLDLEGCANLKKLPNWVGQLKGLTAISLKNCVQLEYVPLEALLDIFGLQSLECAGCKHLWTPPQEVCNQGGLATINFLRAVKSDGKFGKDMTLFLIGDGEAGKTSTAMALRSDDGCAHHIRSDQRTVGIDVLLWEPAGVDLRISIFDLAGQAVYSKTHRFFLSRRAFYVFVWRPSQKKEVSNSLLRETIKYWLDCLQNQIPGSHVVLVVTHIDEVDEETLNDQCDYVQGIVQGWTGTFPEEQKLQVHSKGQSFRINCISGSGVQVLKNELIKQLRKMPWYGEALPSSWILLKDKLALLRKGTADWSEADLNERQQFHLDWQNYHQIAIECGIEPNMVQTATTFLHDTGVIRYFGSFSGSGPAPSPVAGDQKKTVYISPEWMMNIMKGLLRHDRHALTDFFMKKNNKIMLRRVNRLNVCGRLHESLLPFLWPHTEESKDFWDSVKSKSKREWLLWKDTVISSTKDCRRAVVLLEGFLLLIKEGEEYIVPGVLPPARLPCVRKLDVEECPFRVRFSYQSFPPGAFEVAVVRVYDRLTRLTTISKVAVEFTACSAFYRVGPAPFHIVQMYSLTNHADSLQDSGCSQHLVLRSSSNEIFMEVKYELDAVEKSFVGLVKIEPDEHVTTSGPVVLPRTRHGSYERTSEIECAHCRQEQHRFKREECLQVWNEHLQACNPSHRAIISCPKCHNDISLVEILTSFRIPEFRICPCCLENSQPSQSMGHFNAGECRLRFSEVDTVRTGSVTCYQCLSAGRLGQISIMDVAPSELFASGISVLDNEMQEKVNNLIANIELRAGVTCSNRFGQNELQGRMQALAFSIRHQKLQSMKGSQFVLMFLSDAYFVSKDCREEFSAAMRWCKCIIPIIIHDTGLNNRQGICLGWTGAADGIAMNDIDYWNHASKRLQHVCQGYYAAEAAQIEENQENFLAELETRRRGIAVLFQETEPRVEGKWEAIENKFSEEKIAGLQKFQSQRAEWSYLQDKVLWCLLGQLTLFSLFDFPLPSNVGLNHDSSTNCPTTLAISESITEVIMIHLQRPGKVEVYSDFSKLGVQLSYFDVFISENGGRGSFKGLTTEAVKTMFVYPKTMDSKLSLCEILSMEKSVGSGKHVETAEWFYSHAWRFLFLDVVDAARRHFKNRNPVIWFDVFSVSQHKAENRPFEWWNSIFLNAIGDMGKVLMLMQPFQTTFEEDDGTVTVIPAWTTLTRVWCVFELFACESTMSQLDITMTEGTHKRMMKEFANDITEFLKTIELIDCETSEAGKAEDRDRVFEVIRRTIGFPLLNSLVVRVIERWLFSEVHDKIEEINELKSPMLASMERFCKTCFTLRSKQKGLGRDHPDALTSQHMLACLYYEQGLKQDAQELLDECLEKQKRVLGQDDPDTITSMNTRAGFCRDRGDDDEAEKIYRHGFESRLRVLGSDHKDTVTSMQALAAIYQDQARREGPGSKAENLLKMAETLLEDCFEIRNRVLGAGHPATLTLMHKLATLYLQQEKTAKALDLFHESLKLRENLLGREHPDTLSSMNSLAMFYRSSGQYIEADELCRQRLQIRLKVRKEDQGEEHLSTLAAKDSLRGFLERCLQKRREVLGREDPATLSAMQDLAEFNMDHGEISEAERLCEDCLQARKDVLGNEHPDTLRSMEGLASLHRKNGSHLKADELLKECLQIRLKVRKGDHGEEHLSTLAAKDSLRGFLERCLQKRREVLGREDPATLSAMQDLAEFNMDHGEISEAERLCEDCLQARKDVLGNEHPDTLRSMEGLASLHRKQGRQVKADILCVERLWIRLKVQKEVHGEKHPNTVVAMHNLSTFLTEAVECTEDLATSSEKRGLAQFDMDVEPLQQLGELFLRFLQTRQDGNGRDDPDSLKAMLILAEFYKESGQNAKAEVMYEECLKIGEVHGSLHEVTEECRKSLTIIRRKRTYNADSASKGANLTMEGGQTQTDVQILPDRNGLPSRIGPVDASSCCTVL